MEEELAVREIDMLMEGLDVLPSKGATGEMMMGLMDTMMAKTKEDAEVALRKRQEKEKGKEAERRQLLDKITLLKAKLIKMKDRTLAGSVMGGG